MLVGSVKVILIFCPFCKFFTERGDLIDTIPYRICTIV